MVDVADQARVSVGTVSRVMNGEATVNPEIRRRVFVEARRIRCRPKTQRAHLAVITPACRSAAPAS